MGGNTTAAGRAAGRRGVTAHCGCLFGALHRHADRVAGEADVLQSADRLFGVSTGVE
jgi:hypothetical protein